MRPPTLGELFVQATTDTCHGYNLIAPRFEMTSYATPLPWLEPCFRRIEQLYGRGELGADLGAGTGRATRELLKLCDAVEAYDFSPGMLKQAEAQSPEANCQWIQADLATVDLGAARFDRIITFGAWGHILEPWREDFVRRVVGALKPGGVFFTLTADPAPLLSRRALWIAIFDNSIKLRNRILGNPFHMYYGINHTLEVKEMFESQPCQVRLEPIPGAVHPDLTLFIAQAHS